MFNIIVVSHGDLGEALLRAVEMIAGPQERVFAVGIEPGQSPDAFSDALEEMLRETAPAPTLVLIDLLGGTPYNVAARRVVAGRVECITGANLPMLLELVMSRDELPLSDLAASIEKAGRESVRNLRPLLHAR